MENLLGNFIKKMRKDSKLDQNDLALKAGVSLSFIRRLEQKTGDYRIENVNKVLNLFGYILYPTKIKEIENKI